MLALAHDVACAMLHLHSEQIVHSDLKASNVLLTKANTFAPFTAALGDSSSGSRPRPDSCAAMLAKAQALAGGRLVAKVADFGKRARLAVAVVCPFKSMHTDCQPRHNVW